MNLPNKLTCLRMIMVPFFVAAMVLPFAHHYLVALVLAFFVPQTFTAIAFDSGGVASGPLTATFMLPFAMGACSAVGGNVMTDAFGLVALVAMMPLITVQVMGFIYVLKTRGTQGEQVPDYGDADIIELCEV